MDNSLLSDLYVISLIKENTKVCCRNNHLSLNTINNGKGILKVLSWSFVSLQRWINNDNRNENMKKIEGVINKAIEYKENDRIVKILRECIIGLENLSTIYYNDAACFARIKVLIENIKNFINENSKKNT